MKSDLDRLMDASGIDALIILPGEHEDPYRAYLTNGAHFSGMVIKKRAAPPVLIANSMEKDEAAKSGLHVYDFEDFGYSELAREYGNNLDGLRSAWYRRICDALGLGGKVTFYGVGDVNAALHTILSLRQSLADRIEIVTAPPRNNIFDQAYETKDPDELARLREVARQTSAVARATREWIAGHRAAGEIVVDTNGAPLTIGAVKRQVRAWLFEHGLEDPEGMIFAQGRDAAVPHSTGDDAAPLRLGQTIVFDLFPREPRGYFHDMTRTWVIGAASREVLAAYETVMEAFRRSVAMCAPGLSTREVQVMVCRYFEEAGHPTVLGTPGTQRGYIHSLAHGLGLSVHEAPYFPTFADTHHLQVGSVFTIEPGLYYPELGYGIRVEDTVYLNEQGQVENLTDCPYDLVIELRG